MLAGFDGFGEKFVEITVDDVGLGVDEASVEVAFEDDENTFDFRGRWALSRGWRLQERRGVEF